MDQNIKNQPAKPETEKKASRPDDLGNIQIDTFIRISDPNTKEVIVEKRG